MTTAPGKNAVQQNQIHVRGSQEGQRLSHRHGRAYVILEFKSPVENLDYELLVFDDEDMEAAGHSLHRNARDRRSSTWAIGLSAWAFKSARAG
jgi:hypothetical protein